MRRLLLALVAASLAPSSATSHSGGVDAHGCHNDRSAGNYHCHSGAYDGLTFASKDAFLAWLGAGSNNTPPPSTSYNRDDWPHWIDEDGDCQDTRVEVLIAESLVPPTLDATGCRVVTGLWYDPYTDLTFTDPGNLDIDHLVPLKEAHDSGGSAWTTAEKRAFANDLGNPLALIAVQASANRSKGSRDPAQWMPPNTGYRCEYVRSWVAIKGAYSLTMDPAEQAAVEAILPPHRSAMPTQVHGISFDGRDIGPATFGIGLSRGDACGFEPTAHISETVSITGVIEPAPEHIGVVADVFVVDRVNMVFTMRNQDGNFVRWNGRVPDLVPYQESVILRETVTVDLFTGQLRESGDHRFFLGYMPRGGTLIYTPTPVRMHITEATTIIGRDDRGQ